MKRLLYLPLFMLLAALAAGCSSPVSGTDELSSNDGTELSSLQKPTPAGVLSAEERAGLLYMREEEKLARDVYITLYDKWNLKVFRNISKSEQTHMDAVLKLLTRYSVPDPVISNDVGVFADVTLQSLYTELVAKGLVSAEEAINAGIVIENRDIADLQTQIDSVVTKPDLLRVYTHLKKASENHLKAFTNNLTLVCTDQQMLKGR